MSEWRLHLPNINKFERSAFSPSTPQLNCLHLFSVPLSISLYGYFRLVLNATMEKEGQKAGGGEEKLEMEFKECEEGLGQDLEINDDVERSKIGIMRALVEREDPSAKEADDFMIRRFLRARDPDIEKASAMFLKYLNWRRTFVPNGFISESEIEEQLSHKKLCMQGLDKLGRPIVIAFGKRHKPTKTEDFKRFVTYSLDKICSRMPQGQEKFVAIADIEGWGYSNSDVHGYIAALSTLQDCYPERLAKLYVVHVPYIFMAAWKIIYPFIDSRTKRKIVFVENKKLKSTLLDDIDESRLADIYGGKLPLVPIQDC